MGFCGVTARFGDGSAQVRLETKRPKYWLANTLPGWTKQQYVNVFREACSRWEAVCDLQFSPAESEADANLIVTCTRLDGANGVLADCEFPMRGYKTQRMRIDTGERWGAFDAESQRGGGLDLTRVLAHEIGHFLGLSHWDADPPPQLLEPTYSQTIIAPQPDEAAFVRRWFGPPATPTPPPAVPAPPIPAPPIPGLPPGLDVSTIFNAVLQLGAQFFSAMPPEQRAAIFAWLWKQLVPSQQKILAEQLHLDPEDTELYSGDGE